MIIIAGITNLYVIFNRNMREFALVGIWALVAIAVANRNEQYYVWQFAVSVALVVFLGIVIHLFVRRKAKHRTN